MSVLNENQLLGAPSASYQIQRSLRFNSSDSAFLSRTPASAGNRKTWTWAGWVKFSSDLTTAQSLFGVESPFCIFGSSGTGQLRLEQNAVINLITANVFRDYAAWYHVVVALDTTQATAANRAKIYINGTEASYSTATYPAQNADLNFNNSVVNYIGDYAASGGRPLSAYLADIHFIDGQALTPSSFGQTDATTGQWIPRAYTGTYGTNGFKLDFADNSAATAAALGKDTSPNGNNWTPNNLSVTAGAGNDSLVDTPTSYGTDTGFGGEVRGNYCTLNPLDTNLTTVADIRQGALEIIPATTYNPLAQGASGTVGVRSGKWYYEGSPVNTAGAGNQSSFGWSQSTSPSGSFYLGTKLKSVGVQCNNNGNFSAFRTEGVSASLADNTSLGFGALTNDIFQIAIDFDAGKVWIGRNGTWYNSGNPAAGTNATSTFTNSGDTWRPWAETIAFSSNWNKAVVNFGQRPFAYTAPSGFKALCDTNLPAGTITTSGSFTGNANADGPFIWLNGVPVAMSINGNSVTFGTHADKLANGFKLRTNSVSYNLSGTNNFSVTATGDKFKFARAQANP